MIITIHGITYQFGIGLSVLIISASALVVLVILGLIVTLISVWAGENTNSDGYDV